MFARWRDRAPSDPYFSALECNFVIAHTFSGDYERAVSIGQRAFTSPPGLCSEYKPLIASLGDLGRRAEAYIKKLLALDPHFNSQELLKIRPHSKIPAIEYAIWRGCTVLTFRMVECVICQCPDRSMEYVTRCRCLPNVGLQSRQCSHPTSTVAIARRISISAIAGGKSLPGDGPPVVQRAVGRPRARGALAKAEPS
jgi:hypothetical protein